MKMGIERVLKEKFGDEIKDICQVYDEQIKETTVEVSSCIYNVKFVQVYSIIRMLATAGSEQPSRGIKTSHKKLWWQRRSVVCHGRRLRCEVRGAWLYWIGDQSSHQGEIPRYCQCWIDKRMNFESSADMSALFIPLKFIFLYFFIDAETFGIQQ